jgi:phosphotransferase family enzyme
VPDVGAGPEEQELREVIPRLLGRPMHSHGWIAEAIFEPVVSATAGIWRYRGEGWSVVLKLLHHSEVGSPAWQSGDDEHHWFYWRREALAYESGLLDSFAGPLRAPRCLGVFYREDDTIALWLEDLLAMVPGGEWSIERYRLAAEHLGIAQATAVSAKQTHESPWLSRRWLRDYVERRAPMMDELASPAWSHPLLRDSLDPAIGQEVMLLWQSREQLLSWVERAPQTICHLDVHPKNLFAHNGETVLIDWAFVGIGALGEDVGNLIFDAVWDFHVPPSAFEAVEEALTSGYLRGLREAGRTTDIDAARLAILASGAAKYLWILPAILAAVRSDRAEINRRPASETIARWAPMITRVVEFAHRAADLATALGR